MLSKDPTQGLDNTKLTAEKQYAMNITEQHKFNFKFLFNELKIQMFFIC